MTTRVFSLYNFCLDMKHEKESNLGVYLLERGAMPAHHGAAICVRRDPCLPLLVLRDSSLIVVHGKLDAFIYAGKLPVVEKVITSASMLASYVLQVPNIVYSSPRAKSRTIIKFALYYITRPSPVATTDRGLEVNCHAL